MDEEDPDHGVGAVLKVRPTDPCAGVEVYAPAGLGTFCGDVELEAVKGWVHDHRVGHLFLGDE